MRYKFCPQCGSKLINKKAGDDGLTPFCSSCNKFWFDSFHTCVIILVANEYNEIVLLKQSHLSDKYLTFVSGYMVSGENAKTAAIREVKEELGIELETINLIDTYWFEQKNLLMIGFIGYVPKCEFLLSTEVDSASWVSHEHVPNYLFPNKSGNAAYALYMKYENLLINRKHKKCLAILQN